MVGGGVVWAERMGLRARRRVRVVWGLGMVLSW